MRFRRLPAALALGILLAATARPQIRIATWNVAQGKRLAKVERELSGDRLSERGTDVLALQEIFTDDGANLAQRWAAMKSWNLASEGSNAILSRWPIAASGMVRVSDARQVPWADLVLPDGERLRVYSVHLTFAVNLWPFVKNMRLRETEALLTHAAAQPHAVVLAGDFNSLGCLLFGSGREPGIRLLLQNGYEDALAQIGGGTHRFLGRLDWIFALRLTVENAERGAFAGSDHRWLRAELKPE